MIILLGLYYSYNFILFDHQIILIRKKIRLSIIISFLTLFISPTFSQSEWIRVDSPTSKRIWRIHCLDSLNCWAAGDSGLILRTIDGGSNWEIQNTTIYNNILDISFLNHELGWAVAIKFDEPSGSYFLKTTNGGTTWSSMLFDSLNVYFFTVKFLDSLNGFLAGAPSYIFYRTGDGGMSWNIVQFDSSLYASLPIIDLEFYSKQYGFACGGQRDLIGVIWKTTNYGLSWSSYELGPEPLIELYIVDSLNIVGVGGDFEYGTGVARSTNGGNSWTYVEPGFFGVATGLTFRNVNEAWACLGGEGKFIFSSNGGLNWEIKITPEQSGINDITFTDSLHGFAVGDNGVILKYIPPPVSVNDEPKGNIIEGNYLLQNFPNPFNLKTKIHFALAKQSFVELSIYDILGNEIVTLLREEKRAGSYEIDFDASNLVSGLYICTLKTLSNIKSVKMIIVK